MLIAARWFAGLTLLGAFIWAYVEPKFDSYVAASSAFVVFLGFFATPKTSKFPASMTGQTQTVQDQSNAIQAGRDVVITMNNTDNRNGPK